MKKETHTMTFNFEATPEVREALEKLMGPDGSIRQIAKITRSEDCPRKLFMDTVKRLQLKD